MEIYIDSSKERNYKFRKNRTEEIIQNIENIVSRIRGNVVLAREKGINFNYFDSSDVVRHSIVMKIIEAYTRYEDNIVEKK